MTTNTGTAVISFSGWYDNSGYHDPSNQNYYVGSSGDTQYNDFLVFDISALTGPVTSASFTVDAFDVVGSPFTYQMFDVGTSISDLESSQGGALGIYNDLSSGISYGGYQFTSADSQQQVTITLNANGVDALNNAIESDAGSFAVGGTLYPSVAATPEPSSLLLLGTGILGLAGAWRRRASA